MSDDDDDDDLFASLGGSLMKDLLADLAVDDGETGWMSLEELETELAHLDSSRRTATTLAAVPEAAVPSTTTTTAAPSAASMVVANQVAASDAPTTTTTTTTTAGVNNPSMDAWSLSFQKFSAASLEQDFLQADSARKNHHQQQQQQQPLPPGLDLTTVPDYDVNERAQLAPPPGIKSDAGQQQQILSQAASKLMEQLQQPASDDMNNKPDSADFDVVAPLPGLPRATMGALPVMPKPTPYTPQNSISVDGRAIPATPPPSVAVTPRASMGIVQPPLQQQQQQQQGMPLVPLANTAAAMMTSIPVAVPLPGGPPAAAWQTPPPPPRAVPPPPPHPPANVYCNPHPRAPPIATTALASQYMSARDIGYVVHGILRHMAAAGASTVQDYDVQYWVRRNGSTAAEQAVVVTASRPRQNNTNNNDNNNNNTGRRHEQAKAWSNEHATLGHVVKSNVSRPRALIAQPVVASSTTTTTTAGEHKQRATLWKARIYVDQAYQAFDQVVVHLKMAAPPGELWWPPVQTHLLKLLKCMGMIHKKVVAATNSSSSSSGQQQQQQQLQEYSVADPQAMKLLLKLSKGKVLMSRVLEQALLPPKAVQVALPVLLQVLYEQKNTSTTTTTTTIAEDPADARLFGILARIIPTIPELSRESLVQSLQVAEQHSAAALSSTARMQCVHALLRRGQAVAAATTANNSDTDASFAQEWSQLENAFLQILAGM